VTSARATFFHYLGQRKTQLVIGILCAAATALAGVVPPRFIGAIIDALQQGTTFQTVVFLALASVGFSAADAVFRGIARYLLLNTSQRRNTRCATTFSRTCRGCTSRISNISGSAT